MEWIRFRLLLCSMCDCEMSSLWKYILGKQMENVNIVFLLFLCGLQLYFVDCALSTLVLPFLAHQHVHQSYVIAVHFWYCNLIFGDIWGIFVWHLYYFKKHFVWQFKLTFFFLLSNELSFSYMYFCIRFILLAPWHWKQSLTFKCSIKTIKVFF